MAQDTVDHAGICTKGDDAHARPAAAQEGIRLEDFSCCHEAATDLITGVTFKLNEPGFCFQSQIILKALS